MPLSDNHFMSLALDLARQGEGFVEPNPMVGCVIVRDGEVIGTGWHQKFGGPHAEVNAIQSCGDPTGATAYITLEPCSHTGKTGPCCEAIVQSGISRAVIATTDPNPKVDGRGIQYLQDAGVDVQVGVEEFAAKDLVKPFAKRVLENLPWVIAKWAMTLDGKIATASGSSQWISNESSREIVHQIRGRVDATIVGIGTVLADDPMLNARPPGPRQSIRVVIDSKGRIPNASKLAQTAKDVPVVVALSSDVESSRIREIESFDCETMFLDPNCRSGWMRALLSWLAKEKQCTNVLVEGGSHVFGALNDSGLIDEVHCFVAPKISGGIKAPSAFGGIGIDNMSDAINIPNPVVKTIGSDIYVSGRLS